MDFFVEGLEWDWSKFQHLLPEDVVHLIEAIMPPGESHGEDEAFWGPSSSGKFSIKSAYEELVTGRRSPNYTMVANLEMVWATTNQVSFLASSE